MAATELHIHRLRLPAQAAGVGAQGLAARIEDALRVSSKPAALAHRHVLVRRLRLAATPGASAQSLGLLFERAWQRIAATAQPIASAPATADAVWAADETAARVALIACWARGGDTTAWFWSQVQGRVQGANWVQQAAVLLLAPLDDTPVRAGSAAPAADRIGLVRAGLAVIAAQGALPVFLDEVDDTQAQALADQFTNDAGGAGGSARLPADAALPAVAAAPGTGRRRLAVALQASPSTVWRTTGEGDATSGGPGSVASVVPRSGPEQASGATRVATAVASLAATDTVAPFDIATEGPAAPRVVATMPAEDLASPWTGLWLLLPLLLRHGLADDATPQAALAATLHAACTRFAVPGDDTVRNGIAALDPAGADDLKTPAAQWLRSARIAALREARLPLRHIVHRPGVAWVSATRIDIEFPLAAADVRIRRAGFDLDPGFLPWLGRIVHFHYV